MERINLDDISEDYGVPDTARTLQRGNLAQIASFYWPQRKATFVVVNTHLFWNPACTGEVCMRMRK